MNSTDKLIMRIEQLRDNSKSHFVQVPKHDLNALLSIVESLRDEVSDLYNEMSYDDPPF